VSIDTVHRMSPVPSPGRIGQATAVEQSRAVAEVAAAVQVAQACPRDLNRARAEMRRSCSELRMAESASYAYKRAGSTITGPTVALARELKRCFGNFQSGINEMRRDDEHGQSELQAWAWDVETNARSSTTVVIPHRSYMTGKPLDALRDIYENNANQGARREREMILGLLPTWFVEEAIQVCKETVERGDGTPLTDRQERAQKAMASVGVSRERVERRLGRQMAQWTPRDLADLTVLYNSIRIGELRAEDEFPTPTIAAEDITGAPPAQAVKPSPQASASERVAKPDTPIDEPPAGAPAPEVQRLVMPVSKAKLDMIKAAFEKHDLGGRAAAVRAQRMQVLSVLVDREISDPRDLTADEGQLVIDHLGPDSGRQVIAEILDPGHLEDAAAADGDDLPDPGDGGDPWAHLQDDTSSGEAAGA
jgi:hypothetical protein